MKYFNKLLLFLVPLLMMCSTLQGQSIIIGTDGINTNGSGSDPIDDFYKFIRYQTVYTAAELTAAGLTPYDTLLNIGFSVTESPGSLANYTIKMGHTTASNAAAHISNPSTTVINPFSYTPTVVGVGSFDTIPFNVKFVWNGTDNIFIDICTGSNSFASPYGGVRAHTLTSGSRSVRSDVSNQCGVTTSIDNSNRPQVRFRYKDGMAPTCPAPTAVMVGSVTNNSAIITWTGSGTFLLEYGPAGYTPGTAGTPGTNGTLINPATSPQSLSGLSPLTDYDVYVRQDCTGGSNGYSTNSKISFTTLVDPPANDECSTATAFSSIPTDGSCATLANQNTAGATQSQVACTGSGADDDIWYSFVAPATTVIVDLISVSGSSDRVHQIFSGSCGSLVSIKCSDPESSTTTGLIVGDTYYLRVHTYSTGNSSIFDLCIKTPPPPPANDNSGNAISLTVNADYNCGVTNSGTTISATQSPEGAPTCSATGINDDVWYSFTATGTNHRIGVTGTSNTIAIALYTGTPGSLVFLTGACASTTLNATGLVPATTYYVRVYTTSSLDGTRSNFTICVGTPPPPPANDECSTATAFPTIPTDGSCATLANQNTAGATQSQVACTGSGADDDIWYSFVAPATTVTVDLIAVSGSSDRVHQIFSGSCGSLVSIKCSDPETSTTTGLIIGDTYYLRVHTYSTGNSSIFDLCIKTPPPPPANDECAGALVIPPSGPFPYLTTVVDNTGATNTNDPTNTCQASANAGVWYSFTPSQSGSYTLSLCQSDAPLSTISDNVLSIFTSSNGCAGPFTQLICDDDGCTTLALQAYANTTLTASTTYYILAYGYSTNRGNIQLYVSGPPINDECAGSINLTPTSGVFTDPGPQSLSGSTESSDAASCGLIESPQDIWYVLTSDNDGNMNEKLVLTVTPGNSTADLALALYGGTCGALVELNCVNAGGDGVPETITYTETGFRGNDLETRDNTVYYLRVIDYYGESSPFTISATGSALPVTLVSFDAKAASARSVVLNWTVVDELNITQYIIESSSDGKHWSPIGSVKAAQTPAYSFRDENPSQGINYYRLKMVEANGSAAHSPIRQVIFSADRQVMLAPNPTSGQIYITGLEKVTQSAQISIYNELGLEVWSGKLSGTELATAGIDLVRLVPGTYVIRVVTDSSSNLLRFVKQ